MKDGEGEGGGRDLITRHRSRFPECLSSTLLFSLASPCTHPRLLRFPPPALSPQPVSPILVAASTQNRKYRRRWSVLLSTDTNHHPVFSLFPLSFFLCFSVSLPSAESPINSRHRDYSDRVAKICGARVAPLISTLYHCKRLCAAHSWANIRGRRARAASSSIIIWDYIFKEISI